MDLIRAFELLTTWKVSYASKDELASCDAIAAFSFGQGKNKTPGATNIALAHAIKNFNRKLPILVQWEIADELSKLKINFNYSARLNNGYLNTKGVADQFLNYSKKHNFNSLVIFAHPDHQYRCGEICNKLGFSIEFARIEDYLPNGWQEYGCDNKGYWPNSAQSWTRSQIKFIPFEIKVRLEFLSKGYI